MSHALARVSTRRETAGFRQVTLLLLLLAAAAVTDDQTADRHFARTSTQCGEQEHHTTQLLKTWE